MKKKKRMSTEEKRAILKESPEVLVKVEHLIDTDLRPRSVLVYYTMKRMAELELDITYNSIADVMGIKFPTVRKIVMELEEHDWLIKSGHGKGFTKNKTC